MILIFSYDCRERFHSINLASHFECLDLEGWNDSSGETIRDMLHFDDLESHHKNHNNSSSSSSGMISATMPIVLHHYKKLKLDADHSRIKIGFYRFKGQNISEWIRLIHEIIVPK